MRKRQYQSPVFLSSIPTSGSVIGDGSNQGTNIPGGMTFDEWWEDIAWGGENPDADYNGDGDVDVNDYYDMVAKSIGDDTNYKHLLILPFDN